MRDDRLAVQTGKANLTLILKRSAARIVGSKEGETLPRLDSIRDIAERAGQVVLEVYFRDAQAYMLISMPTDTSTIFGVFQLIRFSQ